MFSIHVYLFILDCTAESTVGNRRAGNLMIFESTSILNQALFAFKASLIKINLSVNELPIVNEPFLLLYLTSNTNVS